MAATTVRTHCKICTNQCGVAIDVEADAIGRIRGDFDHPLSRGYTCPKGRAIGRNHHHPDAITRPMIRRDGALVETGWDEALDDLAARLGTIVDRHGAQAIGIFFGSGLGMDAAG